MIELVCFLIAALFMLFLLGFSFTAGMVAGIVAISTDAPDVFNEWRQRRREARAARKEDKQEVDHEL